MSATPAKTQPTLRDTLKQALHLGRALRLVWQAAPGWLVVNVGLVGIQGLLPLANLYIMRRIVDGVAEALRAADKMAAFRPVVGWVLAGGGVALLVALSRALSEVANEAQSLRVTDSVSDILHAQSIAVDLEYYENSSYYDALHRAQHEAPFRPTRIVSGLLQIAQNGISLVGIAGLLLSLNWVLSLLLFAAALPGALVRLAYSRRLYKLEREQTTQEREAWYYHWMLTDSYHAKEVRLFQLGELFRTRFRTLRQNLREGRLRLSRRRAFSSLIVQALAALAIYGTFGLIAYQAIGGTVTIGGLVMYYQGFQTALGMVQAILANLTGLYEDNLFLTNFYQFLDLVPKVERPARPQQLAPQPERTVAIEGLSFSYPSSGHPVLEDISLTLAPGEVIALVGENGSGKTTLVKLLCRLYDPTAGRITVDGEDLRALDPVCWRKEVSVIFQDYIRYHMTAADNIWLGNVASPPDRARIEQAAGRSGADAVIRGLPQGYDTLLGHWFENGHELSIGEWQKVALARAFMREARLIVLDEPTSALDPLAEAEVFRHFRELIQGRSAILISHRFSTVQMADRIYVLDHGRVVEQGTHQELLAQQGHYAHLYTVQAASYQSAPLHMGPNVASEPGTGAKP